MPQINGRININIPVSFEVPDWMTGIDEQALLDQLGKACLETVKQFIEEQDFRINIEG